MCLIVFAHRHHPHYPLVIAANRDERYSRPTQAADWHSTESGIRWWGGRDLEAGGTWLGITETGRWAAITNLPSQFNAQPQQSRGALVSEFLQSKQSAECYAQQVWQQRHGYNGFNLLLGDGSALYYLNNLALNNLAAAANEPPQALAPGLYGLSNYLLDSWPKVERAKQRLATALAVPKLDNQQLLAVMADTSMDSDKALEHMHGASEDRELRRRLSSIFIPAQGAYGTCSSTTVLLSEKGEVKGCERRFYQAEPEEQSTHFYLSPNS